MDDEGRQLLFNRNEEREKWLFLFMLTIRQFIRGRAARRRRIALLYRGIQRRMAREPYCRLDAMNSDIAAILAGDFVKTRQHLHVTPNALDLFVVKMTAKTQGWSTHFEAVVFLLWLACGSCFRIVASVFNIPRSTTHRIVRRMLDATSRIAADVIKLPTEDKLEDVGRGYEELCQSPVFRQTAGAIDRCQVRALMSTHLHDQYIDQKLYFSILMQGVCDHRGMFIDIFVGLPGSVHDMQALRLSHMYKVGAYPPRGWFLIGDKGYACIRDPIALIPPYKEPLTPTKHNFNYHLGRGRCLIKRVFGGMKTRWRSIYTKALKVSLETGVKVLVACAVMHNICVSAGDVLPAEEREDQHEPPVAPCDEASGVDFRNMLLQLHTLHRNQQKCGEGGD